MKISKMKLFMMGMVFAVILCFGNVVKAASTTLGPGNVTVEPGKSVNITAGLNSVETWSLKLSAGGGSLTGKTEDADAAGEEVSKTVLNATFVANTPGTYKITLSGYVAGSDLKKLTVSKSITITVKAKETPITPPSGGNNGGSNGGNESNNGGDSSNQGGNTKPEPPVSTASAELKMLATSPVDFKGFKSASTGPYKITVENNVTSVKVTATPKDSKAKISIAGNKNLDVGTNKVTVTVTSSDGKNKKTYVIYVTRKSGADEEETPPNQVEEKEKVKLGLTAIILDEGYNLNPEFREDIFEYTVEINEDLTEFPINAIATQDDAKIEITGNTELKEGENIVIIKVTSADGKETVEYKVKVIKDLIKETSAPVVVTTTKTTPIDFDSYNKIQEYSITVIVLICCICLTGIITIILEYNNANLALAEGNVEEYDGYEPLLHNTKDNFNYGSTFIEEEKKPRKRGRSKGKH